MSPVRSLFFPDFIKQGLDPWQSTIPNKKHTVIVHLTITLGLMARPGLETKATRQNDTCRRSLTWKKIPISPTTHYHFHLVSFLSLFSLLVISLSLCFSLTKVPHDVDVSDRVHVSVRHHERQASGCINDQEIASF